MSKINSRTSEQNLFKNAVIVLSVFVFLWVMFITTSPIVPHRLPRPFSICDLNNLSSWHSIEGSVESIYNFRSFNNLPDHPVTITYLPSQSKSLIICKRNIPDDILYQAVSINITYKTNQPIELGLGIYKSAGGPIWKTTKINDDSVEKKITSTWLLDNNEEHKLNWLSGSYEGAILNVIVPQSDKNLTLTIYDIFLE